MTRWTEEAVQDFERRKKEWDRTGTVTTHTLSDSQPANKRGGRVSKYGNIKAEADGMTFDSKAERGRWMDLRLIEKVGDIAELRRQVVYPLDVNGVHICDYKADFTYLGKDGLVVEDSKGYRTREYMMKAKLMLACHGIKILET
jgi:hypothetical protein